MCILPSTKFVVGGCDNSSSRFTRECNHGVNWMTVSSIMPHHNYGKKIYWLQAHKTSTPWIYYAIVYSVTSSYFSLKIRMSSCSRLLIILPSRSLSSGALLGHTSRRTLSIGRVGRNVNMFLGTSTDVETGNVHELSPNANVALADKNTCMMDGLGKALLEDLGLQTSLQ